MNITKNKNLDETVYFGYSATLRIYGTIPDQDFITKTLGLTPTHTHKRGEPKRKSKSVVWEHDMWSFVAQVPEDRPLDIHINKLWEKLKPHKDFIIKLKENATVDIFCGYKSNSIAAGFEISPKSLEMFIELGIPFGISIIIV